MKPLIYLFVGITVLGLLFLVGGLAGSHGHFRFRQHQTEDWIIFGTPIIGILGLVLIWAMKDNIHKDSNRSKIQGSMEYYKLMESLYLAMEKTKNIKGRESGEFASGAEFSTRLGLSRDRLHKFEMTPLKNLWIWFAPGGAWEYVGEEGIDLGTEIFQLTERLRSKVK